MNVGGILSILLLVGVTIYVRKGIKSNKMHKFTDIRTVVISLAILVSASCTEKLERDWKQFEPYTENFNLAEIDADGNEYLEVSAVKSISKSDVEKYVIGNGWKSVAVYELDKNKDVARVWELKDDLPLINEQTLHDCFEVKGFGENQLIQYGLLDERYEDLDFAYDENDNSISLDACWFVAHNGKLVFLSDDVMVCVDGKEWVAEGRNPYVFMVVFERVSKSTLRDWRRQCPNPRLWI